MSSDQCETVVQVNKSHANSVIKLLRDKKVLDDRFKITEDKNYLLIPTIFLSKEVKLIAQDYDLTIYENPDKILKEKIKPRMKKKKTTLKDALKTIIPAEYHEILPRSFDILGSIAIIELNREDQQPLRSYIQQIGDILLDLHPHLESVYAKAGDISGTYRTRALSHISGNKNTLTKYRENNSFFYIDVANTFFSPRLSFERDRVSQIDSSFTTQGIVWDMFCGVGPFLLQIAQKYPEGTYIGTDINSRAIELAVKNLSILKISSNVQFHCMDVNKVDFSDIFTGMKNKISRIIMNLPEKNLDFIPILPKFIHPDGTLLHIYQFNEKENPLEEARKKLTTKLTESNLSLEKILSGRLVKPFSPALETTVLDVIIKRNKNKD